MNNRPLRTVVASALVLLTLTAILVVIAGVSLLLGVFEGFDAGTQAALEWGAGLVILAAILGSLGWLGHRYYRRLSPGPELEPQRLKRPYPLPVDGYLDLDGSYVDGHGQRIPNVHDPKGCEGRGCTIHHPSDHSMRHLPTLWRGGNVPGGKYAMERKCEHGVGHPDPDHLAWAQSMVADGTWTQARADAEGIHGCGCGCCARTVPGAEE